MPWEIHPASPGGISRGLSGTSSHRYREGAQGESPGHKRVTNPESGAICHRHPPEGKKKLKKKITD